jgi:hypothetical protein
MRALSGLVMELNGWAEEDVRGVLCIGEASRDSRE